MAPKIEAEQAAKADHGPMGRSGSTRRSPIKMRS